MYLLILCSMLHIFFPHIVFFFIFGIFFCLLSSSSFRQYFDYNQAMPGPCTIASNDTLTHGQIKC